MGAPWLSSGRPVHPPRRVRDMATSGRSTRSTPVGSSPPPPPPTPAINLIATEGAVPMDEDHFGLSPPPHPLASAAQQHQQHSLSSERSTSALPPIYPHLTASGSPPSLGHPRLPSIPALLDGPAGPGIVVANGGNAGAAAASPAGSLDSNLRQLAILQALVARQQAIVEAAGPTPPPTPSLDLHSPQHTRQNSSTFDNHLLSDNWSYVAAGLNSPTQDNSPHSQPTPHYNPVEDSTTWSNNVTQAELAVAQDQLNLWSHTAFASTGNTPAHSPPTPSIPHLQKQQQQHHQPHSGSFDWAAIYGHHQPQHSSHNPTNPPSTHIPGASIAPRSTGGLIPSGLTSGYAATASAQHDYTYTPPSTSIGPSSTTLHQQQTRPRTRSTSNSPPNGVQIGASTSIPRTRAKSIKGKAKAAATVKSEQDEEDEYVQRESQRGPLLHGTPEEIEEDKKRRNTEASARFRAKKKQRDAALQQSSIQLRERVNDLEKEAGSLKAENSWLRDLVSERAEISPAVRDLLSAPREPGQH